MASNNMVMNIKGNSSNHKSPSA